MKIVSFSMHIILNLLFSIRYVLERFVYLKMSQMSVPMITLNTRPMNILKSDRFSDIDLHDK